MINLTREPIVSDSLTIGQLFLHIDTALTQVRQAAGAKPSRGERRKIKLAEDVANSLTRKDDPPSVMISFCEIANRKPRVDDKIVQSCKYYSYSEATNSRNLIRNFCRLVLYIAWSQGDVILPPGISMQKSITEEARKKSPSLVLNALASYEPDVEELSKFGPHVKKYMNQYSLSWIYSTNWIEFSDIEADEAARLHVFISDKTISRNGNPSSVERAITLFQDRGYINIDQKAFENTKNAEFVSIARERLKSGGQSKDVSPSEAGAFMPPRQRTGNSFFFIHPQLEMDGLNPPIETIRTWDKLFSQYLIHRQQTGRTATDSKKKHLHTLADYISILLPTYSIHSSEPIPIPASPKEFTRYPFVDQTLRPASFPTYLQYLEKRGLAPSSRKGVLYTIEDFFQWVEANLNSEEFSRIAGPGFRCPITRRDFPFVRRPSGTTKIPFSEEIYPLLFHYVHELERIGMYLDARPEIANDVCIFSNKSTDHHVDLTKLDVEFSVSYKDEIFKISQIPQRIIVGTHRAARGINLSALRLLTFVLETGLRAQSSQWLDKDSWANHLDDYSEDDPIRLIHINTDKTGQTKDIRVLSRVVEMLTRQQDHRAAKGIPEIALDYEGRSASPFKPLAPLFANEDGSVISDQSYLKVWEDILLGMQGFLQDNGIAFKPLIRVKPPNEDDPGISPHGCPPFCRLKWSAVHTPHALRASFVTRRSGSTEYVILAELVGHNDPVVTAYYDVPEFEKIVDGLEHHERPQVDASSPISELRSQLTSPDHDRENVIRRFGISSLRDLHESETSDKDPVGIEFLKSSQAAELVFRDTHICVAGEVCPDDVILASGGPMRCGTCKLACKSVEHLPAIEAECRRLTARIQATSAALSKAKQSGADQTHLRRLHSNLMTDSYQLVGWQDGSMTLRRLLHEKNAEGIVTGSPDIIKLHLKRVVRQVEPAQFLVDRIVDAKMYPSMSDEVLQRQASRMARKLAMSDQELFADENEEVMALYSLIRTRLKALGMTWDEAGKLIEREVASLIADAKPEVRLINASS
ncbi:MULTISPECIES: hypothetical protein [unclassified Sulfitobacter]|uniref:hypothetical protein n=1 Tax=unclassified Sulfitobacter TaxID=196795 RepID=UPI0023E2C482|nr:MULTISPECIES: hypothetical protein [unclassified Sulfitobacter]MDF3384506.1 hypothetical protein [Sulfitobacter sp. Ks11]MDF3387924.1 hypothetical protein [Sulfitobacter sp. M85]MDF3391344.1 hypothetical protein [Sulfitobacter sp. Ks16]MDF3401982.1 hypothetical protein [Sulfitobacter sp. KE39]MDF3405403.1 hypothetical protein [Sulfitobacter sp. Ks35]